MISVRNRREGDEIASIPSASVRELLDLPQSESGVAGPYAAKRQVELKGNVECDSPLKAELSGEECVYYSMQVEERYEEDYVENEGQTQRQFKTRTGSSIVASNKRSTSFLLDDGTGRIAVDPAGAVVDARQVVDNYQPYTAGLASLEFGGFVYNLSAMQHGKRRVLGHHYRESIIGIGERLYVQGELTDSGGMRVVQKPGGHGKSFIVSVKSEEELLHEKAAFSMGLLIAAMVLLVAGVVLLVVG
jgi:hypothetical protein